jgi:hypothetical protein
LLVATRYKPSFGGRHRPLRRSGRDKRFISRANGIGSALLLSILGVTDCPCFCGHQTQLITKVSFSFVRHWPDVYLLTISFNRSCVRTSPHCQSAARPPALGFEPIASNLEMSVKLEVEFREKQNAHVLRRSIVTAWPYPRGMRRHLVSPCDDVGKLVLQILGRRKSLLENLNEIMQCARVSEEAIADHRIAKLIAKINVSEVLARFCCALRFLLPNLLAEIVEAFPYRLQKKPCFFPISFSREIKSFSRQIKHRRSKPITLFTKPEAFTVAPNPKRATRRDCKPTPPMILSEGLVVRRMICSARRHAFVSNAFRDA